MADYVFTAQETHDSGIRVTVTIRVPGNTVGQGWEPHKEAGELASMAAARAMSMTLKSRTRAREEAPF